MTFFSSLKYKFSSVKQSLKDSSFDNLIWIVNIVPTFLGYSILGEEKCNVIFWVFHFALLLYVYGVGIAVFLAFHAQGLSDFIKSYVNLSLFILISNNSYWFLVNKPVIASVIAMSRKSNELVSKQFEQKRQRLHLAIKIILLIFYGVNYFNEFTVYMRNRADVQNSYGITPCPGLEPLTQSPNREICIFMLCATELTITFIVLNYQALVCLLIAHAAVMYYILSDEINQLNEMDEDGNETQYSIIPVADRNAFVKDKLHSFIVRHCLILETTKMCTDLYSMPIGVNFISNAVCIVLFFFLTIEEYIAFSPILMYCVLVFFLYCFLCQKLIDAAEVFERAVYSCGWENFELNEKRCVYNMLVAAQRPVVLTAAWIIPVNIATFGSTCQAMYKFITVFKL